MSTPDHAFRDRDPRQPCREDAAALEEDARLRNDIRLLGRILGDTVRDQEGADVFDLVERIRQTSIRFHRDEDRPARRELEIDPRRHVDLPRPCGSSAPSAISRTSPTSPRTRTTSARCGARSAARRPRQHACADAVACAPGRDQRRPICAASSRTRSGQPGADGASDRGPPQEHDGPRDGDRGAARPPRARAADAGRDRGQPTSSCAARC